MKQHILVTGGAGYIGSILVPTLLDHGYRVTVIDNFLFKQNSLAHVCNNPNFDVKNGDVRDTGLMSSLLKSVDVIIPLAALVGAPMCSKDPLAASSINKDSAIWLLKNCSKEQCILMPTTNSAYGKGGKDHHCDENSPLYPLSLYAKDKVEVEKALLERGNAISFRLATVFGMSPRMRIDLLVNDFTYRAVYDRFVVLFEPHFKRNYIHVRDVARTFLHGLDNYATMKDSIFNVGLSEANLSKYELCLEIQKLIPEFVFLEAPIGSDPDQRNYIVSNEKLEKTGWKPVVGLRQGLQELIKGLAMIKNTVHGNV
jgi:nucleoside-diphosphate-sugar epimerase